jgi:hypothetical protein
MKLFAALVILVCALPAYARGEEGMHKSLAPSTLYFGLKPDNCPHDVERYVNRVLKKGLGSLKYCALASTGGLEEHLKAAAERPYSYYLYRCSTYGMLMGSHRVVTGTITWINREFYRQMGQTGKWQYLEKLKREKYYRISVSVVDPASGEVLGVVERKTSTSELAPALADIIRDLEPYFPARMVETGPRTILTLSVAGSAIVPLGAFRNYGPAGGGFMLSFDADNLIVKNLAFQAQFGYASIDVTRKEMKQLHELYLSAHLGYALAKDWFSFTPFAGFGYQFHLPVERGGETPVFPDPYVSLQTRLRFMVSERWSIFVTPGYALFFEQKDLGHCVSCFVGFGVSWY